MPDFFVFSKIIPLLLYPFPLILLLLFIFSWSFKKNSARWLVRLLVVLLWCISTPWFADLSSRWWEVPRVARSQLPPVSDAAIVLGGITTLADRMPDHTEFNKSAERITEAVDLWRAGRVKNILITSGNGDLSGAGFAEAPVLADWVRAQGVPPEAVVVESASRNTRENATLSLPLVKSHGFKSLVLITSAAHMRRSEAIFKKAGYLDEGRSLVVWPVDTQIDNLKFPFNAVPDPNSLGTAQSVLREAVGYVVYFFQGYL